MKDAPLTPAALAALMSGDIKNAVVAVTPGGIEAQEAAGQRDLCAQSKLPKCGMFDAPINRAEFEALGITFGPDLDDLFVAVTLPLGWAVKPTDHAMWSDLVDDFGRKRASIFYKAAFYDRRATVTVTPLPKEE